MNIFVANLSFRVQSEDLEHLFEKYGTVSSAKIIMNRETGKSRGYGFVEMPEEEKALKAIESLNEHELDGNIIAVKKAKPRENGYTRKPIKNERGSSFSRKRSRYSKEREVKG